MRTFRALNFYIEAVIFDVLKILSLSLKFVITIITSFWKWAFVGDMLFQIKEIQRLKFGGGLWNPGAKMFFFQILDKCFDLAWQFLASVILLLAGRTGFRQVQLPKTFFNLWATRIADNLKTIGALKNLNWNLFANKTTEMLFS